MVILVCFFGCFCRLFDSEFKMFVFVNFGQKRVISVRVYPDTKELLGGVLDLRFLLLLSNKAALSNTLIQYLSDLISE